MVQKTNRRFLLILGFIFLSGAAVNVFAQNAPYDFDGDGKTDIATYGTNDNEWWHRRSSDGGNGAIEFGSGTDLPVPADYTGDGITDPAFFRYATGEWFIVRSEDFSYYSFPFGLGGMDRPMPGDYDGDGKADPAVFRFQTGIWYILRSATGQVEVRQFGQTGDYPLTADYDGDGRDDPAIYRPSTGEWWIDQSRDGTVVYKFEINESEFVYFVPADYTGDGKADPAFILNADQNLPLSPETASNHRWFILRSEDRTFYSFPFGIDGDIPAVGDYDNDGIADTAVYRRNAGVWYIRQSTGDLKTVAFGTDQDYPVAAIRYAD